MPECSLVQNLIRCFRTFCSTIEFNPYLPFESLIFYDSHNIYIIYRITRNFGGGKLWRLWQILEIHQI